MKLRYVESETTSLESLANRVNEIIEIINEKEQSKTNKPLQLACGQIWRLIDEKKFSNIGFKNDLMIVLSKNREAWNIGCFWQFDTSPMGGARQTELSEYELWSIAEYVTDLSTLTEKG